MWSSVVFEHPATFDTLAMEENKKKEIMNDLITFTKSKDYYKKNWQVLEKRVTSFQASRHWQIHHDRGHGQSTRTGQRKKEEEKDEEGDGKDPVSKKKKEDQVKSNESSKVTLSGLLNFIDGLWFGCRGERIIVFTTNYVEILDPALIRRGRTDKHIELSYCFFEAFKVLARNYLDLESHDLFETFDWEIVGGN
ncbi:hypothetical protein RHGRI_028315 [Rhododendron griersonianum]|uniref:ATPase AAA-type core domain-containing protein n=1 Tax=Rhododendron griersonianum TaxID=479676 RepID=A0AAV6IHR4_9ERIC|nr:hypothetical protein RHGRI_028315 [Rhododendron griersonianum]